MHTFTLSQLSTCCNWYLSVFEGLRVRVFPELEIGEIMHRTLELLEVELLEVAEVNENVIRFTSSKA